MISVIIPAYNVGETIIRTINSVKNQTYSDIEIIVVDDGSTDATEEKLDKYQKEYPEKIKVIHKQNEGVTIARLTGVKAAQGEWIGFVDGDDEIEPDMYEFLLNNAKKYKADISHCGYKMVFADGRENYFYNTGRLVKQDKPTGLKDLLEGSYIEPGLCNKLFHKSLFHSLFHSHTMDTSIKINEDLLMNYILFSEVKQSVFEDVCKYHYLVRSSSTSRAPLNNNKIYDPIRVKQIILELDVDDMKEDAEKAYIGTCVNVYNSLMLDRTRKFLADEVKVRKLIQNKKKWISLLSKKQQILANLILYLPKEYKLIYRFYAKYILKSQYE